MFEMEDGIWSSIVVLGREKLVSEISTLEVAGKVIDDGEGNIKVEDPRTGEWVELRYYEAFGFWEGEGGRHNIRCYDLVVYND